LNIPLGRLAMTRSVQKRSAKINIAVVTWAVVFAVPLLLLVSRPWVDWLIGVYLAVIIGGFVLSAIIGVYDERERLVKERHEAMQNRR